MQPSSFSLTLSIVHCPVQTIPLRTRRETPTCRSSSDHGCSGRAESGVNLQVPERKAKECYLWLQRLCSSSFEAVCKIHMNHKYWHFIQLFSAKKYQDSRQHTAQIGLWFQASQNGLPTWRVHELLLMFWFGSARKASGLAGLGNECGITKISTDQWRARGKKRRQNFKTKYWFINHGNQNALIRKRVHFLCPQHGKHPSFSEEAQGLTSLPTFSAHLQFNPSHVNTGACVQGWNE